ncbi:hypothetical protein [Caulobacter mirabilis]|uniref:Glycine zipper domain-containing protein n=1 Tax=Caulobacter mirabilis TaxID=69666 RepID=A0A2D2AV96_9CAUL|nr:hypothetical protein [Caulobacter mirabilis]ATQ41918.1 hypothetical protein CSW64_05575 [Caulobacter mirabilis]
MNIRRVIALTALIGVAPALQGCLAAAAGAVVGTAVGVTGAAVGTTAKVGGAVVGAAIPDGDKCDGKKKKKKDCEE